jgi:hypothetical protein
VEPTAFVKHSGITPSVASKYQCLKIASEDYIIVFIDKYVELKLFAHLLLIVSFLPLIISVFGRFSGPSHDTNVSEIGHVCRKDEVRHSERLKQLKFIHTEYTCTQVERQGSCAKCLVCYAIYVAKN